MKHALSMTELLRMTPSELRKELQEKRAESAKMRIALSTQSEKNHALYRTQRGNIARMTMALDMLVASPALSSETAKSTETSSDVPAKKTVRKTSQSAKKSVKGSGSSAKKKA